ncbi:hypothetical protein HYV82_03325 [Candidatus Woesearchaeota archaeon]|nr:hypothetical protein [Candidatus Woesearchaeota archaeon]
MDYFNFCITTAKTAFGIGCAAAVLLGVSYVIWPPSNAATPYIVRASGQEATPSCVYRALASLQRTIPQQVNFIPVLNGAGIEGIMVIEPGSPIPDPIGVKTAGNPKLERILNACTPQAA